MEGDRGNQMPARRCLDVRIAAMLTVALLAGAGCVDDTEGGGDAPEAQGGEPRPAEPEPASGNATPIAANATGDPIVVFWNDTYEGQTGLGFAEDPILVRSFGSDVGLPGLPTIVVDMTCSNTSSTDGSDPPRLHARVEGEYADGTYGSNHVAGNRCDGTQVRPEVRGVTPTSVTDLFAGVEFDSPHVGASGDVQFAVSVFWDSEPADDYSAWT